MKITKSKWKGINMLSIKQSQNLDNAQSIVIFCTKEGKLSYCNDEIKKLYTKLTDSKILSDDKQNLISSFIELNGETRSIVFIVIDEKNKFLNHLIQRSAYLGVKESLKYNPETVAICVFDESTKIQQQKLVEGAIFATYKFNKYHLEQKEETNYTFEFVKKDGMDKEAMHIGEITAYNIFEARNIVNEPANNMTPEILADYVLKNQDKGYTVQIFDENEIQNLKMGAYYGVAKGSDKPPRLIVMKYMGAKESSEVVGLVGKGLTYDSGGYSLKTTDGMKTMKADMGGAASVIAAISTLAQIKAPVNVIAIVAACENLISGHSYKPGDILCSMAGKYIEVDNTDAEGRLTLIDAVTYAIREQKVTSVIDVATLTGAAVAAFGKEIIPVLTNCETLWQSLLESSDASGDKIWRLPADEELGKMNKSEIADLKNSGRGAGTITAGMFIGEFVEDKPWAHLDIAGPAYVDDTKVFCTAGGTGVPTSLLCELVQRYFKNLLQNK